MEAKITNENNMLMMARYEDNYFDLAIVDPPYGINESNKGSESRPHKSKQKNGKVLNVKSNYHKKKNWDLQKPNQEYFTELYRVSKNQIIWGGNYFNLEASSCWVVWDKLNGGNDFADCELAYTSFKSAVRKFTFMWAGMMQGSNIDGGKMEGNKKLNEKRIHPTQKPVQLYKWLLMNYAKEGDKILDTHLGSGSIAIACHDLKFDLTACELDSDYYIAAMKRIENHKAQLKLF